MTETADFFVAGGTLRPDDPSYVTRPADHDLLQQLQAGEFCYVLTPRQMGKSSLMVRTAQRLRANGARVAVVDLTRIGGSSSEVTADQWYLGVLTSVRTQLRLATDAQTWWDEHTALGIAQRFITFLHDVLLAEYSESVAIMIDEIDSTLNLGFRDDFFAAIRAIYNERATDPIYQRLTFALFGVATPTDLIQDRERTPFNIGRRIDLREFTLDDAQPLQDGLAASFPEQADTILQRIFYWTSGHPYLTQKLCQTLQAEAVPNAETDIADDVDAIVQRTFFSDEGRKNPNLTFVQDRIANSPDSEKRRMLQLYRRVQGGDKVVDDDRSSVQNRLELYGLVGVKQGQLQVRNQIYGQVFDGAWVGSMMPVDRRQRRAVLAGVGALVLAFGVLLFIWLQPTTECSVYQENFRNFEDSNVRLSALADLIGQGCQSMAQDLFYDLDPDEQKALFVSLEDFPGERNRLLSVIDTLYRTLDTEPDHDVALLKDWYDTLKLAEIEEDNEIHSSISFWIEGRRYAYSSRYEAAVVSYEDALRTIPDGNHPALRYDIALAYSELTEYEKALEQLDTILRIAETMPATPTPTTSPALTTSPTPFNVFTATSLPTRFDNVVQPNTAVDIMIPTITYLVTDTITDTIGQVQYQRRFRDAGTIRNTVKVLLEESPDLHLHYQENITRYQYLALLGISAMPLTVESIPTSGSQSSSYLVTDFFVPTGWMLNGIDLTNFEFNPGYSGNCHTNIECYKISWQPDQDTWVGLYWLYPDASAVDWTELGRPGCDFSGATDVTFWARGEAGGEIIEFGSAFYAGNRVESGPITLSQEWKEYSIDIHSADLTNVVGAFAWFISATDNSSQVNFYLDNIRYKGVDASKVICRPTVRQSGFNFEVDTQKWTTSEGEFKPITLTTTTQFVYSGIQAFQLQPNLRSDSSEIYRHTETVAYFNNAIPEGFDEPGPYNLAGKPVSCFVYLPSELAPNQNPEAYIQLFIKDKDFRNQFSPVLNILPSNINQWLQLNLIVGEGDGIDSGFASSQVNAIGIRIVLHNQATLKYFGPLYVDHCTIPYS